MRALGRDMSTGEPVMCLPGKSITQTPAVLFDRVFEPARLSATPFESKGAQESLGEGKH